MASCISMKILHLTLTNDAVIYNMAKEHEFLRKLNKKKRSIYSIQYVTDLLKVGRNYKYVSIHSTVCY